MRNAVRQLVQREDIGAPYLRRRRSSRRDHWRLRPTLAERIFKALVWPCSEAVERDREACDTHFRHNALPFVSAVSLLPTGNRYSALLSHVAEHERTRSLCRF